MNEDSAEIKALIRSVARLEAKCCDVEKRLEFFDQHQREIIAQMNRWKGATPVLLAVGGVVGWLLTQWEVLGKLLAGKAS